MKYHESIDKNEPAITMLFCCIIAANVHAFVQKKDPDYKLIMTFIKKTNYMEQHKV